MEVEGWNRARLESYIDTTESLTIEFKSFRSLVADDKKGKADRIFEASRDVAGMANEQGGHILYGIDEVGVGAWKSAGAVEGGFAPEHKVSREWFLQVMRDHIQPPLTELDAYDVRLNPEDEFEPRSALVVSVPQARGQARQTDDFLHWRRDAQGLAKMSAQQIADVAARSRRPTLEVTARVTASTRNATDNLQEVRTQFRINNPSSAVATFAVLTLGLGRGNGLSMSSHPEWRLLEASDDVKVARLVLASGSSKNWSPITPGFTLNSEEILLRISRLPNVDVKGPRPVGLLRLDHDGESRLYGVCVNFNAQLAKQILLVPFDDTVGQNGFLAEVVSLQLFEWKQ